MTIHTYEEIPKELDRAFQGQGDARVQRTLRQGAAIANLRQGQGKVHAMASMLAEMY